MQKNLGRKSKTPTLILTPTPPPFLTPTSAPKSSQKAPNAPAKGRADDKDEEEKDAIAAINYSNNSVDEPSDDVVDVVAISSATSFAESTSSSAGNISPVVSSFGNDFVDTLIEEKDATSSSSLAATITRNPSPIMPNEEQQQQQHKSNLAATAATTIILPEAVIANTPSGAAAAAAAAAASSNSNEKGERIFLNQNIAPFIVANKRSKAAAAINAGLKRKCKLPLKRKPKRRQQFNDLLLENLFNNDNSPHEQAFLKLLKRSGQDPDLNMYKGGFSFGDDDPEYDKSDPDVTFDDLSDRCTSSLDDSCQSTSEEEIIGDVSMMDHDDVDNLVASKVSSGNMPAYVPKTATTTTTTTTAATTSSSSSGSNNNNKNTTQATTKSLSKKEANAKSFKDLETNLEQQLKDQQKWNLVKSKKIPTLFLPRDEKIQPLLDRLNSIEDNMELHTHQLRKNRGFRIVIRHLHSTTDNQWIRDQLIAQGFQPIFIRVIKHRFSGKPMNLFEVELKPTTDGTLEY
ncbi:hypothetical protein ACLKA6_017882 [Drosophila palustris]